MIDGGFVVVSVLVIGVPVLVGLAMCFAGFRRWTRTRHLTATGTPITATIVDNQQESHSEGRMTFIPVVRFHTREGREITTPLEDAGSHRSHLTNTTIDVLYDPADPQRIQPAGTKTGGGMVAIVFGLAFVGFGILAFVMIHSVATDPMFTFFGD